MTAADKIIEMLLKFKIEVCFGVVGDGSNPIFEALRKNQDKIKYVQVRHEENAGFAAIGYSKYSYQSNEETDITPQPKIGCVITTGGPAGLHVLNAVADAKCDGVPIIVINGGADGQLAHTYTQQDIELEKVYESLTVYNTRIIDPQHAENVMDLAIRTAIARRGPVHITIDQTTQNMEFKDNERSERNVKGHLSNAQPTYYTRPDQSQLEEAAKIINEGKKVAILVGRGALHAGRELEQLAEILGATISKALLGKASVPDDSPYVIGGIGLLGTKPTATAMANCDTLIMIGTSFPYIDHLPKPGSCRVIQIDESADRIGLRAPVDVGLVGDSKKTIQLLMPLLKRNDDRTFLEEAQNNMKAWWEHLDKAGTRMDSPMKPQVVVQELNKLLPSNAVIACDCGTNTTLWARYIKVQRGQKHSVSGSLATMAAAVPYALGSAWFHGLDLSKIKDSNGKNSTGANSTSFNPEKCPPHFVIIGDGGFSMNPSEISMIAQYKMPVKIIIIKNKVLGQIKWEQMVFLGNPEFSCELPDINFAKLAEAYGLTGVTIDDPKTCAEQLASALKLPGGVVIECVVDELEAPLPPKIKVKQGWNLVKSMLRGEKDGPEIIEDIVKDEIMEMKGKKKD